MNKISIYSIYSHIGMLGLFNWMPDSMYLRIQYQLKLHKRLNLNDPLTMNEKLQWLKLHDRTPIYSELVDKYLVRTHIEKLLGSDYLIPLLGVWDDPADIEFAKMPDQFVLKCNHDSGGIVICRDKDKFDSTEAIRKLQKRMKRQYCWGNREWPYKNVRPRVISEQFIQDIQGKDGLTDYKFYCFNGKPEYVLVCVDRQGPGTANFLFFDKQWKKLDYNLQSEEEKKRVVSKPENLETMFEIAETIAKYVNAAFVRVDLFHSNKKIYFGEITFYPHSGMDASLKPEADLLFGKQILLPIK